MDNDNNGILSGTELDGLALWHDVNSNGVSDSGEVRQLAAYKIVALSCHWQKDMSHPDEIALSPQGVTLGDGTTRPSFDFVLDPPMDAN